MEDPTDLDLRVLDLLREDPKSADLLAEALSHGDEEVGVDDVRGSLDWLTSRGLARPLGEDPRHAHNTPDQGTLPDEEDDRPWEITEEGGELIEPEAGIARAPYDRTIAVDDDDDEGGGPDAGLVILLLIALVTGACAAYTLLMATGVLGSG